MQLRMQMRLQMTIQILLRLRLQIMTIKMQKCHHHRTAPVVFYLPVGCTLLLRLLAKLGLVLAAIVKHIDA